MARYIDADKLTETIKYYYEHTGEQSTNAEHYAYGVALKEIDKTPTADVVEVKHGEWIEDGYDDSPCVCSVCGAEAPYVSKFDEMFDYDYEENLQYMGYEETREYIRAPYCLECGAKMDGGKAE